MLGERALDQLLFPNLQKASSGGHVGPPPEREPFSNLLSRFDSRRDETDIVDSSLMTEVDDLSDLAEVEIFVALDQHNLFLSCRKNLDKLGFKVSLVERVIVDLIRW